MLHSFFQSFKDTLMRVLILGSGVVGVTSAYYLAKKGFDVTVIDRQPGVCMETSFANAGQISPAIQRLGLHPAYRPKQQNGCCSAIHLLQ